MHLLQYLNDERRVQLGVVQHNKIYPLDTMDNLYQLVMNTLTLQIDLISFIKQLTKLPPIDYMELIENGQIIVPIFHNDLSHMIVTGTGLTHLNSTILRNSMHNETENLSDAQKIYYEGLVGGKPKNNKPGIRPEWFYKGNGYNLKSHSETVFSPHEAISFGEEAEIVAVYIIGADGCPYRIGFALGNEFSDHGLEKSNLYYLAQSKLCECSIGPEIYIGDLPAKVDGEISIERNKKLLWSKKFSTGFEQMTHSLNNIEHHLFKNSLFRVPGDIHFLFLGADQISFSDDIDLVDGDVTTIRANLFNYPLINSVQKQSKIEFMEIKNI